MRLFRYIGRYLIRKVFFEKVRFYFFKVVLFYINLVEEEILKFDVDLDVFD